MCMLSTPTDGGGGGGAKPTLEEQLSKARSDLAASKTQVDALTKERDDAKAEATRVSGQFDAATKEATDAKAENTKLKADVSTITADRDAIKTKLTTAETNITRLETLCAVKGVDKNATVPLAEESGTTGHVYDQWQAAGAAGNSTEKMRLWREHRAEIRAEGLRRAAGK